MAGRIDNSTFPARIAPSLIGANDVQATLGDLRSESFEAPNGSRLVTIVYEPLPPAAALIDRVLDALAQGALDLWPDWYDGLDPAAPMEEDADPDPAARIAETLASGRALRRTPTLSWFHAARLRCLAGRPPLVGATGARLAAELGMAIAPRSLRVALGVVADSHPPGRLLGLSRAAEWLADATGASVVVVVPRRTAGHLELDGINSGAILEPEPVAATPPPESSVPEALDASTHPPTTVPDATIDVYPILGRPHPRSPGEQLLADFLERDVELRGRFRYNFRVEGRGGATHVADLVWPEGRLVVEVDGYNYHSGRAAFSQDRNRDYELLVNGYATLRLPHDEVVADVELAAAKVRDLVRLRPEAPAHRGTSSP